MTFAADTHYPFHSCLLLSTPNIDLSLTSKSIVPHLYEFVYHFDYTHDLMTSWYIENLRLLGALMWMPSNQILWKRGTDYMKEQKYSYSQRIGKTTFIVNVKQSESAKKPLNTVFQDICKHEVLGGFFTDKSFNLENPQKVSWQTRPRRNGIPS